MACLFFIRDLEFSPQLSKVRGRTKYSLQLVVIKALLPQKFNWKTLRTNFFCRFELARQTKCKTGSFVLILAVPNLLS